jgi:hypothetical protein
MLTPGRMFILSRIAKTLPLVLVLALHHVANPKGSTGQPPRGWGQSVQDPNSQAARLPLQESPGDSLNHPRMNCIPQRSERGLSGFWQPMSGGKTLQP